MTSFRLTLAFLLSVTLPGFTQSADPGGFLSSPSVKSAPPAVTASLVAGQTAIVPGRPFDIALKLIHPDHWHTYWLNPGIGTPTKLTWELPESWTTTPLIWPVPEIKPSELGNQHIYEGTVHLFTTVTPPAALKAGETFTLKASAKWLVCDEGSVCSPGGAELTLTLPVADTAQPVDTVQAELARVKAVQPRNSPAWEVSLTPKWTLTLTPGEGANPDPGGIYFFDHTKAITTDPQPLTREGTAYVLNLTPSEEDSDAVPAGFVHATNGWNKDGTLPSLAVGPPGETASTANSAPAGTAAIASMAGKTSVTFWGALAGLFLAGMILNLMPCVFPVLALKVLGFVQSAGKDRRETRKHSLAYTAGLLIFVWLVAGSMLAANAWFGAELAWGDITRYTGALVVVVIVLFLLGLNLAGLFEIGTSLTSVGGNLQDRKGYAGSFWSGALTMLISTPCSGPFMAVAMGFALKQAPLQQFILFTGFGLGIALPYVLLASSPRLLKKLPRPGAWMETFKKALSFPMFAAAIFFFNAYVTKTGSEGAALLLWALLLLTIAAWIYGHWCVPSRASRTRWIGGLVALLVLAGAGRLAFLGTHEKATSANAPFVTGDLAWTRWSPETLAAERTKGRPVFVNYTTIGCITCETNERAVFKSPGSDQVIAKFKELDVAALRAKYLTDGTPEDDAIRDSLKPWDISTFPAYVMYPADASQPPFLISDSLLSQSQVIEALEKAAR